MSTRARQRRIGEPPPPRVAVRTPDDIVAELAQVPHPDVAHDPDESLAVLERLIDEARVSERASRDRRGVRSHLHEGADFSRAMALVDEAPVSELRAFTKFVVDQLWGVGIGTTAEKTRHLVFDREWEGFGILGQIAFDVSTRSFYPFTERKP